MLVKVVVKMIVQIYIFDIRSKKRKILVEVVFLDKKKIHDKKHWHRYERRSSININLHVLHLFVLSIRFYLPEFSNCVKNGFSTMGNRQPVLQRRCYFRTQNTNLFVFRRFHNRTVLINIHINIRNSFF